MILSFVFLFSLLTHSNSIESPWRNNSIGPNSISCTKNVDCEKLGYSACEVDKCVLYVRTSTFGDFDPSEVAAAINLYSDGPYRYRQYKALSGINVIEKLDNNELDMAVLSSATAASAIVNNADIKYIKIQHVSGKNQALIARDPINNVEGLIGTTIGVPCGTTAHYMLMHFLQQTNMVGPYVSTNKVVVECYDVSELISIWDKHPNSPVDAIATSGKTMLHALNNGGYRIMDCEMTSQWGNDIFDVWAVTNSFLKQHEDAVKHYIRIHTSTQNHYVTKNGLPNLWGKEGTMIKEVTPFLNDLKLNGSLKSIYDTDDLLSDDYIILGEDTVERLKWIRILSGDEQQSCDIMGIGHENCNNKNDKYSVTAHQLYSTINFFHDIKYVPDIPLIHSENLFTEWIQKKYINASFIDAGGWDLEDDVWSRAQYNVDRARVLITTNNCPSDGTTVEMIAKNREQIIADDANGGTGTYSTSSNCKWKITPKKDPINGQIQFNFTLLSLERTQDVLTIRDSNTKQLIFQFTGRSYDPLYYSLIEHPDRQHLPSIVSPGGPIIIELITDANDDQPIGFHHADGFSATFKELSTRDSNALQRCDIGKYGTYCKQQSCFGTMTKKLNAFNDYHLFSSNAVNTNYDSSSKCTWIISGPSSDDAANDVYIDLQFKALSTQYSNDNIKIYSGNNVRNLYNDDTTTTDFIVNFSGEFGMDNEEKHPLPTVRVKGNHAIIIFTSDGSITSTGFTINATVTKDTCLCGSHGTCDSESERCSCTDGWFGDHCDIPQCISSKPVELFHSRSTSKGIMRSNAVGYNYQSNQHCKWYFQRNDTIMGISTTGLRFTLNEWNVESFDKMTFILYGKKRSTSSKSKSSTGDASGGGGGSFGGTKGGRQLADSNDIFYEDTAITYTIKDKKIGLDRHGICSCGFDSKADSSSATILVDSLCIPSEKVLKRDPTGDGTWKCTFDAPYLPSEQAPSGTSTKVTTMDTIETGMWSSIDILFNSDMNTVSTGFSFSYEPVMLNCEDGEYNVINENGQSECKLCPIGTYSTVDTTFRCALCPKGYSHGNMINDVPIEGASSCRQCRTTPGIKFSLNLGAIECGHDHDIISYNLDGTDRCIASAWFPNDEINNVKLPRLVPHTNLPLRAIQMGYNKHRESSKRLTEFFLILFVELLGYSVNITKFKDDKSVLQAVEKNTIDIAIESWRYNDGSFDSYSNTNIVKLQDVEYHTGPGLWHSVESNKHRSYTPFEMLESYNSTEVQYRMERSTRKWKETSAKTNKHYFENIVWESSKCLNIKDLPGRYCIDVYGSNKCMLDQKNINCEDFTEMELKTIIESNNLPIRLINVQDRNFTSYLSDRLSGPIGDEFITLIHHHEPSRLISDNDFMTRVELNLPTENTYSVEQLVNQNFENDNNFTDAMNTLKAIRITQADINFLMTADSPKGDEREACGYARDIYTTTLKVSVKDTRPAPIFIGVVKGDLFNEIKSEIFVNILNNIFQLDSRILKFDTYVDVIWSLQIGDLDAAIGFKPYSGMELYPVMKENGELFEEKFMNEFDDFGLYSAYIGGSDHQELLYKHYFTLNDEDMISSLPRMNTMASLLEQDDDTMDGSILCEPLTYSWCKNINGTRGTYIPEKCKTFPGTCGEMYATNIEAIYRAGALEQMILSNDLNLTVVYTTQEKISKMIEMRNEMINAANYIIIASCKNCGNKYFVEKFNNIQFFKMKFSSWSTTKQCPYKLRQSPVLQKYHSSVLKLEPEGYPTETLYIRDGYDDLGKLWF